MFTVVNIYISFVIKMFMLGYLWKYKVYSLYFDFGIYLECKDGRR